MSGADPSYFTDAVVRRLHSIIPQIPSAQAGGGISEIDAPRVLVSSGGGSVGDVTFALRLLSSLGLVDSREDRLVRTRSGDRVVRELRDGTNYALALAVLRSGYLAPQIRSLIQALDQGGDYLACSAMRARRTAPQLVGILSYFPGVSLRGTLRLSPEAAAELESAWNQWVVPPVAPPGSPEERQQVGDRAELYSVQREHTAHIGASRDVLWVSRDDHTLGYDVEVTRAGRTRRIEVKGSRGRQVAFVLSTGEMRKASEHGDDYELQFWGDIRLNAPPDLDYARLREQGYPIVVTDPARELYTEGWLIEPSAYRVKMLQERLTDSVRPAGGS